LTLEYGSSLTTVENYAFGDSGLTTAYVEPSKQSLFTGSAGWPAGVVFGFEGYGAVCADVGADGDIVIPNTVTSLGEYAFADCSSLLSISFADNSTLATIGSYAFYNARISSIIIPNSVTLIGYSAFADCYFLTNVTFQSSSNLTTIGSQAFLAPGLSGGSVSIDEDKAYLLRMVGKMMYNTSVNGVAFAPYGPMNGSGNVEVPNNVTSIADCKLVVV
jgi:hypothetical protein